MAQQNLSAPESAQIHTVEPLHGAVSGTAPATRQSIGELYAQASHQAHLAACARCREIDAEAEARAAENAASIARRDRIQLGLRLTGTKAVTR